MGSNSTVLAGVSVTILALAGCVENSGIGSSRTDAAASAAPDRPAATPLVERDVEAPDVFQMTEAGLWDGRPSLGGVWVAHPDVTDPERVVIRNEANGETVIGALFRRERHSPGPRFMVSSDAATALGLLAGSPVRIDVTALRREEAPTPEPAPAADEPDAAVAEAPAQESNALIDPEEIETAALDPIEAAAAAIDRAQAQPSAATAQSAADEAGEATAVAAAPSPERSSGQSSGRGGLFGIFRPRNAAPLNAMSGPVPVATAAGTVVATEEIADLTAGPINAAAARAATSTDGSYVQIGIFNDEDNAQRTAARMRQNGVVPTVLKQESADTAYWRVVVGPANTRADRSALLRKVKGLGFPDAYAATR